MSTEPASPWPECVTDDSRRQSPRSRGFRRTFLEVVRKVEATDLVGAAEIADRLGIARQSVHQLAKRHHDFPRPIALLKQARVWSWRDVERWARATGRLP